MKDNEVRLSLQDAMRELVRRFPDRAIALFVMKSVPDEMTHYVSNASRDQVLRVMRELGTAKDALPGIPSDPANS